MSLKVGFALLVLPLSWNTFCTFVNVFLLFSLRYDKTSKIPETVRRKLLHMPQIINKLVTQE